MRCVQCACTASSIWGGSLVCRLCFAFSRYVLCADVCVVCVLCGALGCNSFNGVAKHTVASCKSRPHSAGADRHKGQQSMRQGCTPSACRRTFRRTGRSAGQQCNVVTHCREAPLAQHCAAHCEQAHRAMRAVPKAASILLQHTPGRAAKWQCLLPRERCTRWLCCAAAAAPAASERRHRCAFLPRWLQPSCL